MENKKERTKFKEWKAKTKKEITPLIVKFLSQDNYDSDMGRKVGQILDGLNNPFYDIQNHYGKHYDATNIIAIRILLEIQVEEFIEYISE